MCTERRGRPRDSAHRHGSETNLIIETSYGSSYLLVIKFLVIPARPLEVDWTRRAWRGAHLASRSHVPSGPRGVMNSIA